MDRVDLLGTTIHNVTMAETLVAIDRFLGEDRLHLICTPNADHVVKSWHDPEFRTIINTADLAIPDGMAVVYASRLLGTPLRGNVGGRLLVPRLCERAAEHGYRIFFFGAAPGVAAESATNLRRAFPALPVAGVYCPPLGFDRDPIENRKAIDAVNATEPDIVLIALGAPRQEKWAHRHRAELRARVAIGVGGTFDILAGRVREAPAWATRLGLEWLFRMLQDPRRLGQRYLIDDQEFVRRILFTWCKQRINKV